ncbi:MAG TPA: tetratricopeptide repeat protein [Tepidisphaeraceae bacterium]|nr:tetratricopeptide repeat protein [Tepidisphaeraceae bacterium]
MASRHAQSQLAQLWQLPLLVAALGLFGYAAYRFIDPKPAITNAQRLESAQSYLKKGQFDQAIAQANKLLNLDKLKPEQEGALHLLLAQTLEAAQKQRHLRNRANYQSIIDQTRLALADGVKPDADIYRRVAESDEGLGKLSEALEAYRQSLAADPDRPLALQRKIIEMQLAQNESPSAEKSIEQYLTDKRLGAVDRAWAMLEQAQAMAQRGQYTDAQALLEKALALDLSPVSQGQGHYWLGYCLQKLGKRDEAERVLRVARDQLRNGHPLDPEAAYLIGKIRQEENDPRQAISFFETILVNYPQSRPVPLARLGRALCRIALGQDDAALSDIHDLVLELTGKKNRDALKPEAISGLKRASAALAANDNLKAALEVMADEQSLDADPPPDFFGRLGSILQRRAVQVQASVALAGGAAEKNKRHRQAMKLEAEAGDSYMALANGLTLVDDHGQAEAILKAVDLFDGAGASQQAISALELYASQRPDDGQTPDAILRLGRLFQSTGRFDRAIAAFQKIQFRYPQSFAASRSGVPLAECLIAKGPAFDAKAERVLRGMLEDNPILTPEAEEFRLALIELAQLYYRTGRYEDAIVRLEETTQRYPQDPRTPDLLFLMADSYRKSAALLLAGQNAAVTQATDAAVLTAAAKAEAITARNDRLQKARDLFARVIEAMHDRPPTGELGRLYQKLSFFYRADCAYDLHDYEEALHLYDAATLRYPDDPCSVAAYVQIINAYLALGRPNDARTANERAKWLLRRMTPQAFDEAKSLMSKENWDQWLRETDDSGMYAKK